MFSFAEQNSNFQREIKEYNLNFEKLKGEIKDLKSQHSNSESTVREKQNSETVPRKSLLMRTGSLGFNPSKDSTDSAFRKEVEDYLRQLESSNHELQGKLSEQRQAMSQVEEREEKYLLMIKQKNATIAELEKKIKTAKTDSIEFKRRIEELENSFMEARNKLTNSEEKPNQEIHLSSEKKGYDFSDQKSVKFSVIPTEQISNFEQSTNTQSFSGILKETSALSQQNATIDGIEEYERTIEKLKMEIKILEHKLLEAHREIIQAENCSDVSSFISAMYLDCWLQFEALHSETKQLAEQKSKFGAIKDEIIKKKSEEVELLRKQIEDAKREAGVRENVLVDEVSSLKSRIEEKERVLVQKQNAINSLKELMQESTSEIERGRSNQAKLKVTNEELKKKVEECNMMARRLQEMEEIHGKEKELLMELARQEQDSNSERMLKEKYMLLEEVEGEHDRRVQLLNQSIEKLEVRLSSQLDETQKERNKFQAKLRDAEGAMHSMKADVEQLKVLTVSQEGIIALLKSSQEESRQSGSKIQKEFEEKLKNFLSEKDELSKGFGLKFKSMDQEIIVLTGQIESLKSTLAESTSKREGLEKMLEAAGSETTGLMKQLSEMERAKSALVEDVDTFKREASEWKQQLDHLKLQRLESSEKLNDSNNLTQIQIKDLERQLKQKDRDISIRYEEHAKKVEQLEAQYQSLELRSREREELLASQISRVSASTEIDQTKEKQLLKETASLQQLVESKDKILIQQAKDYEKLSCELVSKQTELKNLKKELICAEERLKESEVNIGPMYESLKNLTNELQDVTTQRNQLQLSYEAATAELSELLGTNNKVLELEERLGEAEKSKSEWESDKEGLLKQIAQLMIKGLPQSKPVDEEEASKEKIEKRDFEKMRFEVP